MFKSRCISIQYATRPEHIIAVAVAVAVATADNILEDFDSLMAMLIDQQPPWRVKTIHVALNNRSDRNRWLNTVYLD